MYIYWYVIFMFLSLLLLHLVSYHKPYLITKSILCRTKSPTSIDDNMKIEIKEKMKYADKSFQHTTHD